jgi:hypothetical protein
MRQVVIQSFMTQMMNQFFMRQMIKSIIGLKNIFFG